VDVHLVSLRILRLHLRFLSQTRKKATSSASAHPVKSEETAAIDLSVLNAVTEALVASVGIVQNVVNVKTAETAQNAPSAYLDPSAENARTVATVRNAAHAPNAKSVRSAANMNLKASYPQKVWLR